MKLEDKVITGIATSDADSSIVADTDKIRTIAEGIIERKKTDPNIVVVVSAMGKTTDGYIHRSKSVTDKPCKRELAALLSTGEMISASMLAITLEALGCKDIS